MTGSGLHAHKKARDMFVDGQVSLARSVHVAPRLDTCTCRELSARGFPNRYAQLAAEHVKTLSENRQCRQIPD